MEQLKTLSNPRLPAWKAADAATEKVDIKIFNKQTDFVIIFRTFFENRLVNEDILKLVFIFFSYFTQDRGV